MYIYLNPELGAIWYYWFLKKQYCVLGGSHPILFHTFEYLLATKGCYFWVDKTFSTLHLFLIPYSLTI